MKYNCTINRIMTCCALLMFGFLSHSNAQVKIIETIAGGGASFAEGIPATASRFITNYMIAADAAGNLYIAENGNNRVRMINAATGIINTIAGTGTGGYTGEGIATNCRLNSPVGVAVDASGQHVYIGDEFNNRIRMVDMSSGLISTVAGTGVPGYTGDGTAAITATIDSPRGVAVDAAGDFYFSEGGSATTMRVRRVDFVSGNISTVAGTTVPGYGPDGGAATASKLNNPRGVYVDATGNLYIADLNNNRVRIVDGTGTINTFAGTGVGGVGIDGILAVSSKLNGPLDMKTDATGNIFIADAGNNAVRMVNTSGTISTVAGTQGSSGYSGDGGIPTVAKMIQPASVAILANGNYYISDRGANVIRYVYPDHKPTFTNGSRETLVVCENSGATSINTQLAVTDSDQKQTLTWSQVYVSNGTLALGGTSTSNGGNIVPTGKTYTPKVGFSGTDTFIVQVSDGVPGEPVSLDTVIVTVNPLPVVAPLTGPHTVCVGSSITLSDATALGTWLDVGGNAVVSGGVVTGNLAGVDLISYTVTNSCGSTAVTYSVTINPLPNAGVISGATTVCVGSTTPLSDIGSGAWTSQNTNASVNISTGLVTGNTAGSDVITYTVGNSCGVTFTTTVITVLALPAAGTISGPTSVCVGATINLSDPVFGGGWTNLTGNAGVSSFGVVNGLTAGPDVITYTYSNACGSAFTTYPITVNPLPGAGLISGPIAVCVGANITLSDPVSPGVWSSTTTSVATISGGGVVTGVTGGSDLISYAVTNVCGTAYTMYPINVISVPSAGTITGPTSVCVGATINLSDAIPGGGWTESTGNASVSSLGATLGLSAGTDVITYSVSYSCGSASTTYTITVNPLADPGTITGPSSVCLGSTTALTDATLGGLWSVTNSKASVSGGTVSGLSVGVDTILYSVTNGCGTVSASQSVAISPIVTPGITFSALPGFTSCFGNPVTYTALPVNGGLTPSYQWKVNGTAVAVGSPYSYTPTNGDVIECDMTSSAACISKPVATYTVTAVVNPTVVPSVTISTGLVGDTVCVGTNTAFTASPVNGGSSPAYLWSVNGTPAGPGNPFYYVPSDGDIITAVLTSNQACAAPATVTSNSVTMTVVTTEVPTISIWAAPGNTVCSTTDVTFTANTVFAGVPPKLLRWTKNGVNVATGPTYHYIPVSGDNVYCMLESSSTCLLTSALDSVFSNHITMAVEPNIVPSVTISSLSGGVISKGQSDVIVANVAHPTITLTYQWSVNGVPVPGATAAAFTFVDTVAGTAVVNCVVGSGDACNNIGISNLLNMTISDVGVKQLASTANSINLMPNPNNGTFTIKGSIASGEQEVTLEITDIVGQVVYRNVAALQNGSLNQQIALSDVANGVYMLHIISHDTNEVIRFSLSK